METQNTSLYTRLSEASTGLVRNKQLVLSEQGSTATRMFLWEQHCTHTCPTGEQLPPQTLSQSHPKLCGHRCPFLFFGVAVNREKRDISSQHQRCEVARVATEFVFLNLVIRHHGILFYMAVYICATCHTAHTLL